MLPDAIEGLDNADTSRSLFLASMGAAGEVGGCLAANVGDSSGCTVSVLAENLPFEREGSSAADGESVAGTSRAIPGAVAVSVGGEGGD
jgi:hypothetical protein